MSMDCYQCNNVCASDHITCITCNANLHIKCMHSVGIIKNSWRNINTSPAYVVSILNSGNILYVCISYKPHFYINNVTPPSQMTPITLSSISSKLDEIKEIVNNSYTNINNKSFSDDLKNSIEPKLNIIMNKINKTDNNNTKYPQLDNKLSCTIEHIAVTIFNNEYIKYLFVLLR